MPRIDDHLAVVAAAATEPRLFCQEIDSNDTQENYYAGK